MHSACSEGNCSSLSRPCSHSRWVSAPTRRSSAWSKRSCCARCHYPSPERLQRVGWSWNDHDPAIGAIAPYKYEYLRDRTRTFEYLAVWQLTTRDIAAGGVGGPVSVLRVSNKFFPVVGSTPSRGRAFTSTEQQPGASDVAILSDAFWNAHFGRNLSAIGATVLLDDRPYLVVGIMAPAFAFPEVASRIDVIVPIALKPDPRDLGANYSVIGRLRPGVTRATVQADLDRVFNQLRQACAAELTDESNNMWRRDSSRAMRAMGFIG